MFVTAGASAAQFASVTPICANAASVGANTVYCPFCESRLRTVGLWATRQISVSNCPAYGPLVFTAIAVWTMLGLAAAGRCPAAAVAVGAASAATTSRATISFFMFFLPVDVFVCLRAAQGAPPSPGSDSHGADTRSPCTDQRGDAVDGSKAHQAVDDPARNIGLAEIETEDPGDEIEPRYCDQTPVQAADQQKHRGDQIELTHLSTSCIEIVQIIHVPDQSVSNICPDLVILFT